MTGLTIPFVGLKKQYHNLRSEILDVTDEVLRSGQLMNGNYTAEFEHWLAKKNHVKYATTCHSGTHALEILAEYYKDQLGVDNPTIIMPTFTYAATANAFIRAGWDVHFIDTDYYGILDHKHIPDIHYHAVILVGLYGSSVTHLSQSNAYVDWNLTDKIVLEDGAQHWLAAASRRIGPTAISFDPMKNLPCYGNGGAVVTDNHDLICFAREWKDNGKPVHHSTGTNSRMSELDCAHMMVKTRYIDQWQARRRAITTYWIERLYAKTHIKTLVDSKNLSTHALHKFVIHVDNRDEVRNKLAQRKIETKIHYERPLHETGMFSQYPGPNMLSTASSLARRVLSLPLYPELSDLEVEYVIDQIIETVSETHN